MNSYLPRKLKFKAWNTEARLLMRLNSIDCVKGELFKKNHVLLQFTGVLDQQEEELYELDVVLLNGEKHCIIWNVETNGWSLKKMSEENFQEPLVKELARKCQRLWSYFESGQH